MTDLRSSVEWVDDHLDVIDQTCLPGKLRIRSLFSVDEVVDALRRLVVRGAPAIGVCAAFGLVLALDRADPKDAAMARRVLLGAATTIGAARPTAVNLTQALAQVIRATDEEGDAGGVRRQALAAAERIRAEDRESCQLIGEYGRRELCSVRRILTHCNTGRLATAGWGTALGIIYAKRAAGEQVEVLVCESRPLLQGTRLTAWELGEAGIEFTLLVDGAAAAAMAQGRVDAVVVGCDRVARNGDTANKIGTYAHALAARAHEIPFYVAGPLSSFDETAASGSEILIEERPAEEVLAAGAPAADVWNPAFDVTPGHLITAFITDAGVLRQPYEESFPLARRGIREQVAR